MLGYDDIAYYQNVTKKYIESITRSHRS